MTDDEIKAELSTITALPVRVQRWDVEQGTDMTGADALWVWAIMDDNDVARMNPEEIREAVREKIQSKFPHTFAWTYVRFRTTTEVPAA